MKLILKTIEKKHDLDYEETFNSARNIRIRRKLVPELRKSLEPNFRPSVRQITRWLGSLHKSRRSQLSLKKSGRDGVDSRRVHTNNRSNDVCNVICGKSTVYI
jgi:hypothetical protein